MRLHLAILIGILLFQVWYRAHTFGPTIKEATGVDLWPRTLGSTEPLDCDEAAYAYIGKRLLAGDVLYRDVSENKPPLGYWIYAASVLAGGYRELAIRLMPLPFVLAATLLVWLAVCKLAGPFAAQLAAALFVLVDTDPYLFGNGANMEHFMNAFAAAMLALLVFDEGRGRGRLFASGLCLGAAVLVKQVAIVLVVPALAFLLARGSRADEPKSLNQRCADVLWFFLGAGTIGLLAAGVLLIQGAGAAAFEDVFRYGRALATDVLPEPQQPSGAIRWLTGNADPKGHLPWPFGVTNYLVWWGSGSWPVFLAGTVAALYCTGWRGQPAGRRLAGGFTLAACAQVLLPGLYWPHYYLLPVPGLAAAVAIAAGDAVSALRRGRSGRRLLAALALGILGSACLGEAWLQTRDYLLVAPEELTIRYKGGAQWVVLRQMGFDLKERTRAWPEAQLYIWGWQSPLHFYSGLDSPTRHFFVDNLLRDQADRDHPLITPRTQEIAEVLRRRPPLLIFTGYPPFRALGTLLRDRYLASSLSRGLWVLREDYGQFENAQTRTRQRNAP